MDNLAESKKAAPSTGSPKQVDPRQADALCQAVYLGIKPAAAGLSALYIYFIISHLLFQPKEIAAIMSPLAAVSVVIFLGIYWSLDKNKFPVHWAHRVAAGMATIILLNSLLFLYLTRGMQETTNLVLIIVGMGFFFLSTQWFAAIAAAAVLCWGAIVWLTTPSGDWVTYGFNLLSGTLLAALIHILRLQIFRQMKTMSAENERIRKDLEEVLTTTEEAQRSLATSMAVGQRITSILDLDTLLNQVALLIQARFGFYAVSIFLLDENPDYLSLRAGTRDRGRALTQPNYRLKIGEEGIVSWCATHRRPARVDDTKNDHRYIPMAFLSETRSELALPLEMGAELLGVLDVQSTEVANFKEDDVPFLQMLADQVAIAIHNASLFKVEKSRRRLAENLYEVGRAISSSLNPTEVLEMILKYLADIVTFDRGAVMLQKNYELTIVAARGFPIIPQDIRIPIRPNDVFDKIYRTQKPLAIVDVMERDDWQQVETLPDSHSWLGIPLLHANEVIGMLSMVRENVVPFTEDEVTLATTFSGQAAVAIRNANLYDQINRFNQELEILVEQRASALQKAYDQLEKMDRAKSDFIGLASHELRTPLTVIQGYSQMLIDDPLVQRNPQYMQLTNGILGGIRRLMEIVESMLDIAKIDNRELRLYPTPVPVITLIQSVMDSQKEILRERNLNMNIDLTALPAIDADVDGLRKVFSHLIINAIKFTPDGGKITVTGFQRDDIDRETPGPAIEVVISDTGIGIDPSMQELIFKKFYQTGKISLHSSGRTKFKGGGPGLGLAIAKGIVDAHGGRIWAESAGHDEINFPGSQFHVVLPLSQKNSSF